MEEAGPSHAGHATATEELVDDGLDDLGLGLDSDDEPAAAADDRPTDAQPLEDAAPGGGDGGAVEDELDDGLGYHSEAEEEIEVPKKKKGDDMAQLAEQVRAFVIKMDFAQEQDRKDVEEGRPGVRKLGMLKELAYMVSMVKMHEQMLQFGVLGSLKGWLEPMQNGKGKMLLPHPRVREAIYTAIKKLPLDTHNQEARNQVKQSGIGYVLTFYSKCKFEKPQNQRLVRELITSWMAPIVEEGRAHVTDREQERQEREEELNRLKRKREVDRKAEQAETERMIASQEGLKPGEGGYRYHARVPKAARLDYIKQPEIPEAIIQRKNEKAEKDTGVRARLKKKILASQRASRAGTARSTQVELGAKHLGADIAEK